MTTEDSGSVRVPWDEGRARELAAARVEDTDPWMLRNALRGALAALDEAREASAPVTGSAERRARLTALIVDLKSEPDLARRVRVALAESDL